METKSKIKRNWSKIIEDWSSSGLSVVEYCRRHELATSGFYKARRQLGNPRPNEKPKAPSFLEVTPVMAAPREAKAPTPQPTLRITTKSGAIVEVYL